jgi:enamine deaminase RidA (YjgF/YER057c/UK114 family)
VSTGAPWESIAGYSRAVRVGDVIYVSGTTAQAPPPEAGGPLPPGGGLVGKGDPAAQTRRCLEIVEAAIRELGGELRHVVRTRMYVTDIRLWEPIARVHGEVFGAIRPATAMVQVAALIEPEMLVEIEAEAIVERE